MKGSESLPSLSDQKKADLEEIKNEFDTKN